MGGGGGGIRLRNEKKKPRLNRLAIFFFSEGSLKRPKPVLDTSINKFVTTCFDKEFVILATLV